MSTDTIQLLLQQAMQHHQAGRLREAEAAYRQILAQQPNHFDAMHLLGVINAQSGNLPSAIDLIQKAVAINPKFPQAFVNLGSAYHDLGQLNQAVTAFQQAAALNPKFLEAQYSLATTLCELGQFAEATPAFQQALALEPKDADILHEYAIALMRLGRFDEAVPLLQQAFAQNPDSPGIASNLGLSLRVVGQQDQAVAALRRAVALKPDFAEIHSNLGGILKEQGHFEEAIAACKKAVALKPSLAEAHFNLAYMLLASGEYRQGWKEFEWRWQRTDIPIQRPSFDQPQWDGSPLNGRTILIHAEQGFGDTLQFARLLPMVAARSGNVFLQCPAVLHRILRPFATSLFTLEDPLPAFDLHCPLLSLPRVLDLTLDNLPNSVPYLHAEPADIETWRPRIAGTAGSGLKVGLAWSGNPEHANDRNRSIPVNLLAPLANIPNVQFYSLQVTPAASFDLPPESLRIIDLTPEIQDFSDTAALLAHLDLVISVDSATCHLAGALAKPTFVLLPFSPDWRWLLNRTDSPWYPTLRLFRQTTAGDWPTVIDQLAAAIRGFAQR